MSKLPAVMGRVRPACVRRFLMVFLYVVALFSSHAANPGVVVGWGFNLNGQTNPPAGLTNVVAIGVNPASCYALKSDGTITSWGQSSGLFPAPAPVNNNFSSMAPGGT